MRKNSNDLQNMKSKYLIKHNLNGFPDLLHTHYLSPVISIINRVIRALNRPLTSSDTDTCSCCI